jgi:PEP-CTERM motif
MTQALVHRCVSAGMLCAVLAAAPVDAQAALSSRLGGLAVYDSDRNLTWLANANAIAGTAFDDGFSTSDGLVSWTNALAWADALVVGGYSDWRLPTTLQPDPACTGQTGGGTVSLGGNCSGSEMGSLYYLQFGGPSLPFNAPLDGILATGDPELALFNNIRSQGGQGGIYWSSTDSNAANAWVFNFNNGQQTILNKALGHFAWAVRDGDVAGVVAPNPPVPPLSPVPEPSTWLLMSAGLVGLAALRRRASRRP